MLRVLQEKKIKRVGGDRQIPVDIRVIAATHQDLNKMVQKKRFRSDLRFRLNVFPIRIPSLRERREDIPPLINHFIEKKSKEMMIPQSSKLAPGAIQKLMTYPWPGNVRELENAVERELILCKDDLLYFSDIPLNDKVRIHEETNDHQDDFPTLDLVNSRHIMKALERTKGKIYGPSGAAKLLGVNHSTLRHRMRKLGIPFGRDS
jgi:DNA-binding NtrC family response regulator